MAVHIASIQKVNPGYLRPKRVIDVLFTLLVLIPLCIVIVIVAALIRLDSALADHSLPIAWST